MAKKISCSDVFPGCAFHASAESEAELLEKVAKHAAETHGVTEVTPEILETVRGVIQDDEPTRR
jgi:predicted small metal-binding protein